MKNIKANTAEIIAPIIRVIILVTSYSPILTKFCIINSNIIIVKTIYNFDKSSQFPFYPSCIFMV